MSIKMKLSLAAAAVAAIAIAVLSLNEVRAGETALAELSVRNLSCGACVSNIQQALGGVSGVGPVAVSVTAGRVKAEFEPARIDAGKIAARIAEAGYPATVDRVLDAEEYRLLRQDEKALAERFVGRIGDELVSREQFAEALALREGSRPGSGQSLLKSVWQDLLQRNLLLTAAERAGVVVQDGEVELELERLRAEGDDFALRIEERYGDLEAFRRMLHEEMTIRRTIDDHVLAGITDEARRRATLDRWYRDLVASVPVVVFDPALRAALEASTGGCGGCC